MSDDNSLSKDSSLEYIVGGDGTALDIAFALDINLGNGVISEWADIDIKNVITNPATNSDFHLTPDDIIVISCRSIGAANVKSSATLYFSEQI